MRKPAKRPPRARVGLRGCDDIMGQLVVRHEVLLHRASRVFHRRAPGDGPGIRATPREVVQNSYWYVIMGATGAAPIIMNSPSHPPAPAAAPTATRIDERLSQYRNPTSPATPPP